MALKRDKSHHGRRIFFRGVALEGKPWGLPVLELSQGQYEVAVRKDGSFLPRFESSYANVDAGLRRSEKLFDSGHVLIGEAGLWIGQSLILYGLQFVNA